MGAPKKIYEENFYNRKQKEQFIAESPENKTTIIKRVFAASGKEEERLGKDLCDFTKLEITNLYSFMNVQSFSVLRNIHNVVKAYIYKYSTNTDKDINQCYIADYELKRYCNSYVVQNKIITKETLDGWISFLKEDIFNPCDAFALLCFFEGIYGNKDIEIRNLKIQDFHRTPDGIMVDLCTRRTVRVSEDLYKYALDANLQSRYYFFDNDRSNVREYMLYENGYILRPISRAMAPEYTIEITREAIQRRIKKVLKLFDMEYLTTKDIRASGMIDMIERRSKEMGITPTEFLLNPNGCLEEVRHQYHYKFLGALVNAVRNYKVEWQ